MAKRIQDSLAEKTERFKDTLLSAGVAVTHKRFEGAIHGFTIMTEKQSRGQKGLYEKSLEAWQMMRDFVNKYMYCDECPDYPCKDAMEKENRYTSQYPHRESPLENLRMIREKGMDAFLEQERQQWTCPSCGRPFSVHDRNCLHCGIRIKA